MLLVGAALDSSRLLNSFCALIPDHRSLPLLMIIGGGGLGVIVYAAFALPQSMGLGSHGFHVLRLNLDDPLTLIRPRFLRDASVDKLLVHVDLLSFWDKEDSLRAVLDQGIEAHLREDALAS